MHLVHDATEGGIIAAIYECLVPSGFGSVIESKKISIYKNAYCISLDPRKIDLEKIYNSVRKLLNNSGIQHKLMKVESQFELFRSEFQRKYNDIILIEIWSKRENEVFILINTNHFDQMDIIHSIRDVVWNEKLK